MSRNSNAYTLLFAAAVAGIFGILLSIVATATRPMQERNEILEKKSDILSAVGYRNVSKDEIERIYEESITEMAVDMDGNILEGVDAFNVELRLEERMHRQDSDYRMQLPVYVYTSTETGDDTYIIPLYGGGLWGPIWGYLSMENDFETIKDVIFDHASETPGLGAEIRDRDFQERFQGKKIYDSDELVSVTILKGTGNRTDEHTVDGLSGATITTNGVNEMLKSYFNRYEPFFKKQLEKEKVS